MVYIHYDSLTGKFLGAFHISVGVIPAPSLAVSDDEWDRLCNLNIKVDVKTRKIVEDVPQYTKKEIDNLRRDAYIKEADPLFFKYQRKECTKKEWLDKIQEIKDRYPSPTEVQ